VMFELSVVLDAMLNVLVLHHITVRLKKEVPQLLLLLWSGHRNGRWFPGC